jgi:hypothetical protein
MVPTSLTTPAEAVPIRYRDGRPLKQLSEYYKQDKTLVEVKAAASGVQNNSAHFASTKLGFAAAGDNPSRVHDRDQQTGAPKGYCLQGVTWELQWSAVISGEAASSGMVWSMQGSYKRHGKLMRPPLQLHFAVIA